MSDRLELFSFAELNDDSIVVSGAGGSGYVKVGNKNRPNKARQAYNAKRAGLQKRKKKAARAAEKAKAEKKANRLSKKKKTAKAKAPAKRKRRG